MTTTCQPPDGTPSETWHIIRYRAGILSAAYWNHAGWYHVDTAFFAYVCPLDLQDVVDRYSRLATYAETDAELSRAFAGEVEPAPSEPTDPTEGAPGTDRDAGCSTTHLPGSAPHVGSPAQSYRAASVVANAPRMVDAAESYFGAYFAISQREGEDAGLEAAKRALALAVQGMNSDDAVAQAIAEVDEHASLPIARELYI